MRRHKQLYRPMAQIWEGHKSKQDTRSWIYAQLWRHKGFMIYNKVKHVLSTRVY